jgi:hypothetical protein
MRTPSRRIATIVATAALGVGVLGAVAAPADAATKYKQLSCKSSKGDVGSVRFYYTGWRPSTITSITYKIALGKGGRKAQNDVFVGDGGVAPTKSFKTGDKALGDNKWHTLTSKHYTRGSGGVGARFIFNHAGKDPQCHAQQGM